MPSETATAICCMTMGGVLKQFPKLKVCFAHGGIIIISHNNQLFSSFFIKLFFNMLKDYKMFAVVSL